MSAAVRLSVVFLVGILGACGLVEVGPTFDDPVACADAGACFSLAEAAEAERRHPDPELSNTALVRAGAAYRAACELGHGQGCVRAALILWLGSGGVEADLPRAAGLFEQACSRSEWEGCAKLGDMYSQGWGITPDRERARQLYGKACDGGERQACMDLAQLR